MHSSIPLSAETRREVLVTLGLPIVQQVALRIARRLPSHIAVDDLIGAGAEGLLRAVHGYDPTRFDRFEPYAEARIRGAILDELRATDTLTRHARRRIAVVRRAGTALEQKLGRAPTDHELASELGEPIEEVQRWLSHATAAGTLTRSGAIDPDHIASAELDPAECYEENARRTQLNQAVAKLPARTQEVLALYFRDEHTQAEIGRLLGVTESRICQILGSATTQLRRSLERSSAVA